MKLTVVIPAYNEEQAIGSTIERCLGARANLIRNSPVTDVEIIVVSDGSTDATSEIAGRYPEIKVIVFPRNRGYGAAIKAGFAAGTGELVGFLDADGTCDPEFFATLCQAIVTENAAVALGSRMGPDSRMPRLRRIGNRVYALILSILSNRVVTDAASGMRVIRRELLSDLYPLPDGLHFTPAMSARVLADDRLTIIERPMPYEERVGESKLHVVRDGIRFLRTILEMTLMWRPAPMLAALGVFLLVIMILLAMHPLETRIRDGRIAEDMIYRLLFCSFLGTIGFTMLSAGVISNRVSEFIRPQKRRSFFLDVLDRAFTSRGCLIVLVASSVLLAILVGPGIWTRLLYGYVDLHWSRIVLGGLVGFGVIQTSITTLVMSLLRFHEARRLTVAEVTYRESSGQVVTEQMVDTPSGPGGRTPQRRQALANPAAAR